MRVDKDPFALPDGKASVAAVMNGGFAERLGEFLAAQGGQDVVTVFACIGGQRAPNRRGGRHQVAVTYDFGIGGAGGDAAWPADDERHSVAAFPGVCLDAAQRAHRVVLVVAGLFISPDFRSVVRGEKDERVVGNSGTS